MVQSLQHMHLNGFVTFGLQMNTAEKLTCFEYYFDVHVTYSHVTLLNSQNKYKYVQINIKIHPSFNIKAIPPAKLQSVIP